MLLFNAPGNLQNVDADRKFTDNIFHFFSTKTRNLVVRYLLSECSFIQLLCGPVVSFSHSGCTEMFEPSAAAVTISLHAHTDLKHSAGERIVTLTPGFWSACQCAEVCAAERKSADHSELL